MNQRGPDKAPRQRRTKAELGKSYAQAKTEQVYCRLNRDEKRKVRAHCKRHGLSMSQFIYSRISDVFREV